MSAEDLVQAVQHREDGSLDALMTHYQARILYILRPILPDPRDQEECFHDISLKIWKKAGDYAPCRGSFPAWLTVLSRNTALNFARRHHPEAWDELPEDLRAEEPTPEETLLLRERQELVQRAIMNLNAEEKILFYRKYYYLQSTRQIAAELGTTERAVEGRLYRLRARLRKLLGGDFDV